LHFFAQSISFEQAPLVYGTQPGVLHRTQHGFSGTKPIFSGSQHIFWYSALVLFFVSKLISLIAHSPALTAHSMVFLGLGPFLAFRRPAIVLSLLAHSPSCTARTLLFQSSQLEFFPAHSLFLVFAHHISLSTQALSFPVSEVRVFLALCPYFLAHRMAYGSQFRFLSSKRFFFWLSARFSAQTPGFSVEISSAESPFPVSIFGTQPIFYGTTSCFLVEAPFLRLVAQKSCFLWHTARFFAAHSPFFCGTQPSLAHNHFPSAHSPGFSRLKTGFPSCPKAQSFWCQKHYLVWPTARAFSACSIGPLLT